jgi:hypothetical protein
MGEHPRESSSPRYDPAQFPDSCTKFLYFGGGPEPAPGHLRSIGKSGLAYGYASDNTYFVDVASGIEFLLAAVIHVNANGVFNDDHYEYDEIALPFLRDLGRAVYDHERSRPRAHPVDLADLEALFAQRGSREAGG